MGGDEIYQILKKRLFTKLPDIDHVETVAQSFAQSIAEAEKSRTIAKSAEQIADEIRGSYPFHPSIKDIIALFRNNENYRQTRGLMQFVSRMIRSVWNRLQNDVYLIGLQHLALNDAEVREEIGRISDLRGAIAHDIANHGNAQAELIDAQMNSDAGSQVSTLLLCSSLSTAVDAVRGLNKQRLLHSLIAPNRTPFEFSDAFEHLKAEAWYLHRDRGDTYYFSNIENLRKRLDTEAERAPQPKIDAEMRRRLEEIFKPVEKAAYQEHHALPVLDKIKLDGGRVLLILSPDTKNPPAEALAFYENVVQKNNLCILTGDGSGLSNLEDRTRDLYAITKLQKELPETHPHQIELAEKLEQAEHAFHSTVTATFNRVYYPGRKGLLPARLAMTFTGNSFRGEEQICQALSATAASKLIPTLAQVETDANDLIVRAEELLWAEGQRRVPWRDVRNRALANTRWTWLPPGGLDALRKIAEGRGLWRYTEDGYIEKGPFEQPRTSVSVQERGYNEAEGLAVLEISAQDAGPAPVIYYDTSPAVSTASNRLTESRLETQDTKIWFLAVDPRGEHETGPVLEWTNKLNLLYEPRESMGKRTVELKAVPRGTIRYTLTGANPAEGALYAGPIEIGEEETTVYCYAEDQGVTVKREFRIPRAGKTGLTIDPVKPAKLKKQIGCGQTAPAFALLNRLKQLQARAIGPMLTIGAGSTNATLRFGSESAVDADSLERLIGEMRKALGDETAEVQMKVHATRFQNGHDLEVFVGERSLDVSSNEVEQ